MKAFAGLCLLCFAPLCSAGLLVDLYRQALDSEPNFAAARAQRDAALEALPLARAEILPSLHLSGQAGRLRDDTEESRFFGFEERRIYANTWQAGVSLRQPLLDRSVFARLRQMDEQAARAELALLEARQRLLLDLVGRYFAWLDAGNELRHLRQQLQALQQLADQLETRVETGYATRADLQQVFARRDRAAAEELRAAAGVREAREALRELVVDVPLVPQTLAGEIATAPPEPADPDIWVSRALAHNPGLERAEIETELAAEAIREEQGRRWPRLELRAEHRLIDTAETQLGREAETSQLLLQLDLPLYSGGAASARVRAAGDRHRRSQYLREARQRAVARETRDAYDGIVTGIRRLTAARQAVASQQAALDAVQGGADTGLRTVAEVLDARQQLYAARRDEAAARYAYLTSELRLKAVVGTLVDADLLVIDRQLGR